MPALARRSNICCNTGLPATGAIGFGITPVSGKSLVPLPAARTIAFISLPPSCVRIPSRPAATGLPCYFLRHLEPDQPCCRRGRVPDKERLGVYRVHDSNVGVGVVRPR